MAENLDQNDSSHNGPMMPAAPRESASAVQGLGGSAATDAPLPPPPTFGRQMAQLIIIPAVIAIAAIGMVALFGTLAGDTDSPKDLLTRLKQSSGIGGKLVAGAQDPRYKDRCQAAYNIATMIPGVTDPAERKALSDELTQVLRDHVHPTDVELQKFLIIALGQLGQEGGLEVLLGYASSSDRKVREAVIGGVLIWTTHDLEAARRGLPALTKMLADTAETVRTQAAASVWKLARPADAHVIQALHEAMASTGWDEGDGLTDDARREFVRRNFTNTRWSAALSLAALNDERGVLFVADTLLNREALAKISGSITSDQDQPMSTREQDQVLASTLSFVSASKMTDKRIWDRIRKIAADDPNPSVRQAASQLLRSQE